MFETVMIDDSEVKEEMRPWFYMTYQSGLGYLKTQRNILKILKDSPFGQLIKIAIQLVL